MTRGSALPLDRPSAQSQDLVPEPDMDSSTRANPTPAERLDGLRHRLRSWRSGIFLPRVPQPRIPNPGRAVLREALLRHLFTAGPGQDQAFGWVRAPFGQSRPGRFRTSRWHACAGDAAVMAILVLLSLAVALVSRHFEHSASRAPVLLSPDPVLERVGYAENRTRRLEDIAVAAASQTSALAERLDMLQDIVRQQATAATSQSERTRALTDGLGRLSEEIASLQETVTRLNSRNTEDRTQLSEALRRITTLADQLAIQVTGPAVPATGETRNRSVGAPPPAGQPARR